MPAPPNDPLSDFTSFDFRDGDIAHKVYRKGAGPAVIVMHEMPGITPRVADFARAVIGRQFTVFMPSMFGTDGKAFSYPYLARESFKGLCINKEFRALAHGVRSPITDWLRALCRHAHAECGGPGVGAIGMCFTGGFALSLMVDETVMAPILSQPSLPALNFKEHRKRSIDVAPEDWPRIKERVAGGCSVLGLRFSHDPLCPKERFEYLKEELGDGFEIIEIDSSPGNPWGNRKAAHSVLTEDLQDREGHPTRDALERVLARFEERLKPPR